MKARAAADEIDDPKTYTFGGATADLRAAVPVMCRFVVPQGGRKKAMAIEKSAMLGNRSVVLRELMKQWAQCGDDKDFKKALDYPLHALELEFTMTDEQSAPDNVAPVFRSRQGGLVGVAG